MLDEIRYPCLLKRLGAQCSLHAMVRGHAKADAQAKNAKQKEAQAKKGSQLEAQTLGLQYETALKLNSALET